MYPPMAVMPSSESYGKICELCDNTLRATGGDSLFRCVPLALKPLGDLGLSTDTCPVKNKPHSERTVPFFRTLHPNVRTLAPGIGRQVHGEVVVAFNRHRASYKNEKRRMA